MAKQIVAYVRVSTAQQGRSGLGLEAQRAALDRFAETEGFQIVAEHVESCGRRSRASAPLPRRRARRRPQAQMPGHRRQARSAVPSAPSSATMNGI